MSLKEALLNQVGHYNRSAKYKVVTSSSVLDLFTTNGFTVTDFKTSKVINQDKQGFQKHMIRLTKPEFINMPNRPEVVITNSYDGLSSFRIMLGVYRFICANGLIVGSSFKDIKIKHLGNNINERLINSVNLVMNNANDLLDKIDKLGNITVTPTIQEDILKQVLKIIRSNYKADFIDNNDLLRSRRYADKSNDLYTLFNRIQENVINGGITAYNKNDEGIIISRRIRAIKSIDKNIKINKELWNIMEQHAA